MFLLFAILRSIFNRPKKVKCEVVKPAEINKEDAAKHLSEAIQIKTVSMVEEYADNIQPFIDYRNWLEKTYPALHKRAERTIIEDYSLIFKIPGKNPKLKGGCFLSHIDVVPAPSPEKWEEEPFSGKITDEGFIYGRGAQDMKGHMIALLEGLEYHLRKGTEFERDIYICFGHDEEPGTSTGGASNIVKHLKGKGVEMEFVIDEGGTLLDASIAGIPSLALIGACEKGNGDLEIVVNKAGGHASNPNPPTSVGILAKAVHKIETHPMKPHWTKLTKEMFKCLAPNMRPAFKFVLTNRDLISPIFKWVMTKAAPVSNALVRTTFSPTMLWGADARNVLPMEAKCNINYRMITGETAEDVKAYLEKLLKKEVDEGILSVNLLSYSNPSPEADVKCDAYKNIEKSIMEVFEGTVVSPYPFIAASDARFYNPLTNNVYRFGPFKMSMDDQKRIHGFNERLHKDQLLQGAQFFARCIENTCN